MLTHDEKYVLKKIIKLSKNKTRFNSNDDLLSTVSNKYTVSELDVILDSLYEKNFFGEKYSRYYNGGRAFTVTHDTKKYYEVTVKKIITFLINSVAVPAIVSLITALITALITFSGK